MIAMKTSKHNVISIKFHADILTAFVEDGFMLERRHYKQMRESLMECPRVVGEPWFDQWLIIHRDNLIRTLGSPK